MIQDERMSFDLADRNGKSNSSASLKETFLTLFSPLSFTHALCTLPSTIDRHLWKSFFCLENDTFNYQLFFKIKSRNAFV